MKGYGKMKKIFALLISMVLVFGFIPTITFATGMDMEAAAVETETDEEPSSGELETEGETETSTEEITELQESPDTELPKETEEATEESSSKEDAEMSLESEETTPLLGSIFSVAETETDEESETLCDHGNDAENCPVCDLEEQIAVLPALDEVQAMTGDEEDAVYAQASALADVYYDDLTAEEQAQVSNIDTLWGILDYFSDSLTLALSASSCTHSYTNGICTVCDAYQPATLNGNTYEISNAGQLFWFASLVNGDISQEGIAVAVADADAMLTANIDLDNKEWTPIGNRVGLSSLYYGGTFDGDGHTIEGLYINSSSSYQGLFGYLKSGTVKNVSVCGIVTGHQRVGGVVGCNGSGTVTNCANSATINASSFYVGGVVGYNDNGTVTYCYNSGSIKGNNGSLGGVVGYNYFGTVKNCCNSGTVISALTDYDYVGGMVGWNNGTVTNCYNNGAVSGYYCVGGVIGYNPATLSNSYNYGTVSCTTQTAGGVAGNNCSGGTVTNCYYLYDTANAAIGEDNGTSSSVAVKTTDGFTSGEVAYLLNGSISGGTTWYQNIDNSDTIDTYPVLSNNHGVVYQVTELTCGGNAETGNYTYSNTNSAKAADHSYVTVVTDPTCTEKGYTTYTCSVCGDSYTADETNATGHRLTYTASENIITESCANECGHSATATLAEPGSLA